MPAPPDNKLKSYAHFAAHCSVTAKAQDKFTRHQNVERYRRLLKTATDKERQNYLSRLILEEQQKQKDAGDSEYQYWGRRPQGFTAKIPMREKFTREARAAARQAIVAQANTRARALAPVFAEIRAAGVHSYRGIAAQLNARGIPTARGGRWAATQVRDIVLRSGK
jgi:hypothetical protein